MQYIDIKNFGDADQLVLKEGIEPVANDYELLIKIEAAGVNRPDILQRQGHYPPPPGASPLLGLEASGTVVKAGSKVSRFKMGDQVCALLNGGGYAQFAVVHERHALPVPPSLSLLEAAALPEVFCTVWANMFMKGGLKPGETALVHGGSSGIGCAAIQLCRSLGIRILVTVGNAEKARFCEELGADLAINYRKEDFVELAKKENGGRGVDLILDMVGGDYVARNIKALRNDGRLLQIAWLRGSKIEANFMALMLKRLTWAGSTLRSRSTEDKATIISELESTIWPLIEEKGLRPPIFETFALKDAGKAHVLMESSAHMGKIMLSM